LNEKLVENTSITEEPVLKNKEFKEFISTTTYNKQLGTNFTKEELQVKYPNYEIRD